MRSNNEIIDQLKISALNIGLSVIPGLEEFTKEMFFEFRGRIKQNRINNFIDEFAQFIQEKQSVPLNIDSIDKEVIGDFFESILIMLARTKRKKNTEAFKQIMVYHLYSDKDFELSHLLAAAIDNINEKQLEVILGIHEADAASYIKANAMLISKRSDFRTLSKDRDAQAKNYPEVNG